MIFLIKIFNLLINSFDLLIDFDCSFDRNCIEIDRLLSKRDRNYIKIRIVDTISLLESESDWNQRSNLDSLESESLMIQFWRSNRISLANSVYETNPLPCWSSTCCILPVSQSLSVVRTVKNTKLIFGHTLHVFFSRGQLAHWKNTRLIIFYASLDHGSNLTMHLDFFKRDK